MAAPLRKAGYRVAVEAEDGARGGRAVKAKLPNAVVISLDRLPSHGRQVARYLVETKATRAIPIVFVGGAKEKVVAIKAELPYAVYASACGLAKALAGVSRRVTASSPAPQRRAGYSGTPLTQKLGFKAGTRALVLGAPSGYDATLGALPDGARIAHSAPARGDAFDLAHLFVATARDLASLFPDVAQRVAAGGCLWISWPKGGSRIATDLKEDRVRELGLSHAWVDTKVCAVDADWSGLRFNRRRAR